MAKASPRGSPPVQTLRRARQPGLAHLSPLKADQGLPLRRLLGNLIFQIIEDAFAGLDSLIHLLGVFIAHKYADGEN
jgi:hypothetical protein